MDRNLKKILDTIGRGASLPCYLIYGDEEYLVADALSRIIGALLPPEQRSLNLFQVEGENEDVDSLCDSLLTPPLLSGRKVIVVKDTRLFQSKASSPGVIDEIRSQLEGDPQRAVRAFFFLLEVAGWSVEELRDGQWKRISDEEWHRATGSPAADRGEWLPAVLALCDRLQISGGRGQKDTGRLEEVLRDDLPAGNCLIMTASTVDRRKKLFKEISETGGVLSFSKARSTSGRQGVLVDQVRDALAERGKAITPDALRALGGKTGLALRDSLLEVEKLVAYVGDRQTVERADIDAVVEKTAEESVFDLTTAIVEGDAATALRVLGALLDRGTNHILILTMIAREVRFLLQGQILLLSGAIPLFRARMDYGGFQSGVYPAIKALAKNKGTWLANQHPYVIYNALRNAGRFSREDLIGYMERLADLDRAMKTSGIDPARALRHLLIMLCRRPA